MADSQMEQNGNCINCCRFHRGPCYNQARTCWTCGGSGHIQRFCPSKQRHKAPRGELLPGTGSWCEALGLEDDPLLKSNITSILKQYPGATIYLNDECIYRGVQTYFYRNALPQGPDLTERLRRPARVDRRRRRSRSRSRSPSKERVLKRSRSPLRRYSRSNPPKIVEDGEYVVGCSTSPQFNPYERHSLFPIMDLIDVEMVSPPNSRRYENVYPARDSLIAAANNEMVSPPKSSRDENVNPARASLMAAANKLQMTPLPGTTPSSHLPSSRPALGLRSVNIPQSSLLDSFNTKDVAPQSASGVSMQMDDPHFVLGISKGAREAEIVSGYQQRMWEIELERSSEGPSGSGAEDKAAVNRWEESIRILMAAKSQLLGTSGKRLFHEMN